MTCERCTDIHRGQLFGHSNKSCQCKCHDRTVTESVSTITSSKSITRATPSKSITYAKPSKVIKSNPTRPPINSSLPVDVAHNIYKRIQWIEDELDKLREKNNVGKKDDVEDDEE